MPETRPINYLAHLGNIRRHGRPARFDVDTGEPITPAEQEQARTALLDHRLIEVTANGLILTRRGWQSLVSGVDVLAQLAP